MPTKKKVGKVMIPRDDNPSNEKEDAIIDAIDQRDVIMKHASWISKLREGKIDVNQFFGSVAPDVAVELLNLAVNGSEKARLAAVTDLLDRAGFSKVQKHALATVDASQSKEALLSLLLGSSKELKEEGIEVIDDRSDQVK